VKEVRAILEQALEDTLKGESPNLKIEIDEKLTKDLYIKIYKTILALIRHKHYIKLREVIRENNGLHSIF
jgi:hypothetical protein